MAGGDSRYSSTYYRGVAAVSNPEWFGNNPAPVPPPAQYPCRVESGCDLLAESYERMRNEMRSLQSSSSSKLGGGTAVQPPAVSEGKANPLTQLLENKDVSLSSLLEAAMDPSVGSSNRTEDPLMKKTILDRCEEKIAQLYRLRINGKGMFFSMTQPKAVKFDGVSTLTYNHPRIEFNMVSEDPIWTCSDVVIETKKEQLPVEKKDEPVEKDVKGVQDKANEKDMNPSKTLDKIEVLESQGREPKTTAKQQLPQHLQEHLLLLQEELKLATQVPPSVMANVSYPALNQYRSTVPPLLDVLTFSHPPPILPSSEKLTMEVWAEIEKDRRRKEIEVEWDRLMQDKEKKEKKRKLKKRSQSRSSSGSRSRISKSRNRSSSRARSSHRGSHSRHRSRGRSRDKRRRRKSKSLSLSPSPPPKKSKSPPWISRYRRSPSSRRYHRRSPSPRGYRGRSSSFLRSLQRELERSPPYLHSPPRLREEYSGAPTLPYNDPQSGPSMHSSSYPPPGYDNYYDYCSGPYPPPNPPPSGMDSYVPPGMPPHGPYGSQGPPSHGPSVVPRFGPPMRGPAPWMGPGPSPRWFGPGLTMGPQGPMPPQMQRPEIGPTLLQRPQHCPSQMKMPPVGPRGPGAVPAKTPAAHAETISKNLIDLTSEENTFARRAPAEKTPLAVVDISDDEKPPSTKEGNQKVTAKPLSPSDNKLKGAKMTEEVGKEAEMLVLSKAKVITNLAPPGVSPERETHTKYPNVESEFTRPMRAQFRNMLEPLEKVLDKIRLYQRDSFHFKTLIKSLEAGKIEFMGVHTLHDGLLCKLEINRKQPDKFFKIIIPYTHVGRVLRAIHSTYHDYSIGRIQQLIEDFFCDPHDFPLSKIVSAIKQCKECIEAEEKERERLRKKELLVLASPEPAREGMDQPLTDDKIDGAVVKPSRDRPRQRTSEKEEEGTGPKNARSRRPNDGEREAKARRGNKKDGVEKPRRFVRESKSKSSRKSPKDEDAETYSKFEDLGVSRKVDESKPSGGETNKSDSIGDANKVQPGVGKYPKDDETEEEDGGVAKKDKKVPSCAGKIGPTSRVDAQASEGKDGNNEGGSVSRKKLILVGKNPQKMEQKTKPTPVQAQLKSQPKPIVNPENFKERVRTVQMGVEPLGSQISDLEGLGKKCSDPALTLKAGMLCRRLPPPKGGKAVVKIVVNPACLKQMVEIVHTMAALHAPFQKTVTVFNKHFVPIDGLEETVSEVLNSCAKCFSEDKN